MYKHIVSRTTLNELQNYKYLSNKNYGYNNNFGDFLFN